MDEKQAAMLRAPFQPAQIGRLPKGGAQLEYVGHAATTDRLLQVDPEWTWTPVAHDERGLPRLDEHGGLWITLTVCGVKRLGYGDAGGKKGPNAVKEAIGDAIRNAAMRFGVALDLWAKEDLQQTTAAPTSPRSATPTAQEQTQQPRPKAPSRPSGDAGTIWPPPTDADLRPIDQEQRRKMFGIAKGRGLDADAVRAILKAGTGSSSTQGLPQWQFDRLMLEIEKHRKVA